VLTSLVPLLVQLAIKSRNYTYPNVHQWKTNARSRSVGDRPRCIPECERLVTVSMATGTLL
jgi:hypothetical protein